MKNKSKINNNILKILMLTIILIASITITVVIHTFAEETDVENEVGSINYTTISKWTVKNDNLEDIKKQLDSKNAYDVLKYNSNVYCLHHHYHLYNVDDYTSYNISELKDLRQILDNENVGRKLSYIVTFNNSYNEISEENVTFNSDWKIISGEDENCSQWAIWKITGDDWDKNKYTEKDEKFDEESYKTNKTNGYYDYSEGYDNYDKNIDNNKLYKAACEVDKIQKKITATSEPKVDPIVEDSNTGCGTVEEGEYYKIGPFRMNNYLNASSDYVKDYSGKGLPQPELIAGITSCKIKLKGKSNELTIGGNDGKVLITKRTGGNTDITPGLEFYIKVKKSECVDAEELESITFNYRKTVTSGTGYECTFKTEDGQGRQPILIIGESNVEVMEKEIEIPLNVIIKSNLEINKYITKVEHKENRGVVYGETTERKSQTENWKKSNPVIIEKGDTVTYKIDIKNKGNHKLEFMVQDVLPGQCENAKFSDSINNWIAVDAGQTKTITVTLTATADSNSWENKVQVTKARTSYNTSDKRHHGNVIITKSQSSDWYKIKQYGISIDKYIKDVNHNNDNIKGIDTTINSTSGSQRSTMNPQDKEDNPVYVEYGDTVIYNIVISNTGETDKIYANIEDTLPKKYSGLKVKVNGNQQNVSVSNGKFSISNIEVTKNGTTKLEVTLVVEEISQNIVEENKVEITYIKNINDYNVTKDEMKKSSSDFYKLNNYNALIDKYLYAYNESVSKENKTLGFADEESLVNEHNILKDFQNRQNIDARERLTDEEKKFAPVPVEQGETLTYKIKVTNEATKTDNSNSSALKPATQVRTDIITDFMEQGLEFITVSAQQYDSNGKPNSVNGKIAIPVSYSKGDIEQKDGRTYTKYTYTIKPEDSILNPGDYIVYTVTAKVVQSDLYLYDLDNSAEITTLTNINHKNDKNRVVTNQNISNQKISHEYVRMKDLIIAGKVWLDFNKNGLMDDIIESYINQTKDYAQYNSDQLKGYYDINDTAMMKDIQVKLYTSDGKLIRTTKTDKNGLFTFSTDDNLKFYEPQYYNLDPSRKYSSKKIYQRIDKATNKDNNGNYTEDSEPISYYIEYEYDGLLYKSTVYSGKNNLNNDGTYNDKYELDSNANEFVSTRETFNEQYEYITYNKAYNTSYGETVQRGLNTSNLEFDKKEHTSHLLVNNQRVMTARSFIETISSPETKEETNYIPLFNYDNGNRTKPESKYLKYINLGLALRDDVDISLTKDVYKVKTTIKGEEMEYNFNNNFIINGNTLDENAVNNYKLDKPYGIVLYESDYKYRNEQYSSIKAVQEYFGEESELNTEVTYRIRVNNNTVNTPNDLNVKVDEILDLYDENFIEYTPEMESNPEKAYIQVRQIDSNTGRLSDENKKIKVAEAWYYKPDDNGDFILDNETNIYVEKAKVSGSESAQKYKRVDLIVSNTSKKDSLNEYINTEKYKNYDGYNKLYIRGMENENIEEGGHLDIFVKYVLDKDSEDIEVTNKNWEETIIEDSSNSSENAYYDETTGKMVYSWESSGLHSSSTNKWTKLQSSLIIAEKTTTNEKKQYGLGTENIAQVNIYSVWYKDTNKPASMVDRDSNAGNVGINNSKNVDSADNKAIYEDNVYKTGVNIEAKGTSNYTKPNSDDEQWGDDGKFEIEPVRTITGHVWDDARSVEKESQYIGNGMFGGEDSAIAKAKKNELVPILKNGKIEDKDIDVSSVKAELIEIIETDKDKYYEMTPVGITCDYLQHVRTDENGDYKLHGYTPGKYVVRFTYGDDIEASRQNGIKEQTINGTEANQEDMYLFNGQDYKSTQYTMPDLTTGKVLDDNVVLYDGTVDANNNKIDKVIESLEAKDYNDARDDEIRRLEVNGYSEIMNNQMAEVLQGMANETPLTNNDHSNSGEELKVLVGNTWMFAETIPFTVRAEKIDNDLKSTIKSIVDNETYANRQQIENKLIIKRDFKIENVDFGIEYRPENLIQLEKDIKEVSVTTESGQKIIDLFFNSNYERSSDGTITNKSHILDKQKSVGLDLIQFISNEYNPLTSGLISESGETNQGFVFINYDVDIQQGATVEITYELTAENHGEIDRISKNLDDIRYQNNWETKKLNDAVIRNDITKNKNTNGITNYRANITAANDMINLLYEYDEEGNIYRVSPKVLTATDGSRVTNNTAGANEASRNKLSYYGYYIGYEYYTGLVTDFDTIGELKFNKIIDYVDKDMEYLDGLEALNTNWSALDNTYKELYPMIDWARNDLDYIANVGNISKEQVQQYVNNKLNDLYIASFYEQNNNADNGQTDNTSGLNGNAVFNVIEEIKGVSIDPDGYVYNNMLISSDTGVYTDTYVDEGRNKPESKPSTNPSLSRFLLPMVGDIQEQKNESRGTITLTVSKTISAETSGNELEYQNVAEIVEFTTLTGRRTNFGITIGNVDVRDNDNPSNPDEPKNPKEYEESVPEPDESTTEIVTLIPPQGLHGTAKVIKDVVEVAKSGTQIIVIILAVATIVISVTIFGIKKYKKRRIK